MVTHNPDHCLFAVPKKGRLFEKVTDMLKGAGVDYHREPRLDIALCKDLDMTMVFLPAADISKYVGEGNVDIGVTGVDIIEENESEVDRIMDLGFGKCKLCVEAPVGKYTDIKQLAGKRIVTSFPTLTKKFFDPLDKEMGVTTSIRRVSGSVEAACGLGLADAVVDLVETGTTMKVREKDEEAMVVRNLALNYIFALSKGCWTGSSCQRPRNRGEFFPTKRQIPISQHGLFIVMPDWTGGE